MLTINKMKKYFFLLFTVYCLLPYFSYAAVVIEVDTGVETVNAIEGTLVLPRGVSIGDIYFGNSAVLIWITKPTLDIEANVISFAGLTPGGFRGKYPLFYLNNVDNPSLMGASFTKVSAFKSDGSGTEVEVKLSFSPAEIREDTAPPESFVPVVSSSPEIFDGQHFISFVTQDKGTGVKSYEYSSTWFLSPGDKWTSIDSPYLLSNLDKFKKIHIRAQDQSGNFRIVSTVGPYWYASLIISLILLVCLALFTKRSLASRS